MAVSLRAFLKVAFVAGVTLLTAGPHVGAQSDNPILRHQAPSGAKNPFSWIFGGGQEQRRAAPRAKRTYEPRRRVTVAPRSYQPPAGPAHPAAPSAPASPADPNPTPPQVADAPSTPAPAFAPMHFAVIGDSLGALLGQGLQEIYADRPYVTIHKKARDSSGLVREDFHDWPKALRDLLAGPDKLDAVLVMLGANDRQQLRDDQGVYDPRSERWRELYAQRIDALIELAKEKRVPLIWVGLPVMRNERYAGDMLAFNDIYRARAAKAGIGFVDAWEIFATEQGEYTVTGPDVGGEIVRLRAADGVHFTRAGARKLAFFADKQLQPIVAAAQAKVEVASAPVPAGSPTQPTLQPAPRSGDPLALPLPEAQPQLPNALRTIDSLLGIPAPDPALRPNLQPRPASGPTLALTGPPAAPDGRLLDRPPQALSEEARRTFIEGRPAPAKPGRADDFRL